jgi:RNA recognition motif-containing protein
MDSGVKLRDPSGFVVGRQSRMKGSQVFAGSSRLNRTTDKQGVLEMGRKLYVGNLSYSVRDSDLQDLFADFGTVDSAQVIMDRDTGRSKGFGFVEMSSDEEARQAISALNGKEVEGRNLTVNEARPKEEGGGRGGYGGGGGRGGGYGGGGGGGRGGGYGGGY